jgi:hypothetical protein
MALQICLAIDNCFATERRCEPAEWMLVVRDLGLRYVESGADNQIDPLYSCPAHLDDWRAKVERESEKTGVRVVNYYSWHGTYATLGLGHYDPRRDHLRDHLFYQRRNRRPAATPSFVRTCLTTRRAPRVESYVPYLSRRVPAKGWQR